MRFQRPRRKGIVICVAAEGAQVIKLGTVFAHDLRDACEVFFKYDPDFDSKTLTLAGQPLTSCAKKAKWFYDKGQAAKKGGSL